MAGDSSYVGKLKALGGLITALAALASIISIAYQLQDLNRRELNHEMREWQKIEIFSILTPQGQAVSMTMDEIYTQYTAAIQNGLGQDRIITDKGLTKDEVQLVLLGMIRDRLVAYHGGRFRVYEQDLEAMMLRDHFEN